MRALSQTLRIVFAGWMLGAAFLALGACSASYQSIYEGDIRFEHCYRVDEDPSVPVPQKRACWQDWSKQHTYGQTRDRIEYALGRDRALARGVATVDPTAPPMKPRAVACPMPTSAFATPPRTLASDATVLLPVTPDHPGPPETGALASAPGATCGGGCGKAWLACGEACRSSTCQTRCDESYRTCMRSCF